eukprot:GHVU01080790.1.p1 GENE.GHVU01080790.1~~GHVU01080790.1.p1  ORF type:complete len:123 (-),score=6.76 GHVU01080790.1:159-527(-)
MPVLTYTSLQAKWHRLVSKLPPRREKKGSEAICKESPKTGKSDKMEEEESPGSRGNGLLAPEGTWRLSGLETICFLEQFSYVQFSTSNNIKVSASFTYCSLLWLGIPTTFCQTKAESQPAVV